MLCSLDVPRCDDTVCNNNGLCFDLSAEISNTDDFRCLCDDDYVGSTCGERSEYPSLIAKMLSEV